MSSQVSIELQLPRRELKPGQGRTLDQLLAAAREELEEVGPDGLTVRTVAARAGVSPATAYNYFASRDHLYAELFWRHLHDHPAPRLTGRSALRRLQQVTRHLAETIAGSPALAAAATKSLLGSDPDVQSLRVRTGADFVARFRSAIGEPVDPKVLDTLLIAFSGALLQSGMGFIPYADLADRLDDVVAVIMSGPHAGGARS